MVPERYDCTYGENDNMACSQNGNIPCWVSRPKEKEVMMWYMLTMSLVSTLLVAGEFFYVTTKITVKVNYNILINAKSKLTNLFRPQNDVVSASSRSKSWLTRHCWRPSPTPRRNYRNRYLAKKSPPCVLLLQTKKQCALLSLEPYSLKVV